MDHDEIDDSLNRMNEALAKLIEEAETCLSTHDLKRSQSCPGSIQDQKSKQLLQKKRYLQSQWKLKLAIKQFVDTAYRPNTTTNHYHIHHHHHHYHNHYTSEHLIEEEIEEAKINRNQKTLNNNDTPPKSVLSLASLLNYAASRILPQSKHKPLKIIQEIQNKRLKYRMMLLCTIIMIFKLNNKWAKRRKILYNRWRFKDVYDMWIHKAKLLYYIIIVVNNKPLFLSG